MTGPIPPVPPELVSVANESHRWVNLDDVVAKPIVFADRPFLQSGQFHLLTGIKNAGKTSYLCWLAARVSRGELGPRTRVLWVTLGEDSFEYDIQPRLVANGADLAAIEGLDTLRLPEGADELLRKADEIGNVGLIVIDPVSGALHGGRSSNSDTDVRESISVLNDVASKTGAIVLATRHITIKPGGRQAGALGAILGSSDWVNVPRAVLVLTHDDEDPALRHLFVIAGNRTAEDTPGAVFRISAVSAVHGGEDVTRMDMIGPSDKDPDELIAIKRVRRDSKSNNARELILRILGEASDHEMESDQLESEVAKATGLKIQSVRNIKVEMGMKGAGLLFSKKTWDCWMVSLTVDGTVAYELQRDSVSSPPTVEDTESQKDPEYLDDAPGTQYQVSTSTTTNTTKYLPKILSDSQEINPEDTQILSYQGEQGSSQRFELPKTSTSPAQCQVCGSVEIGAISGTCLKCGTRVHPPDPDTYGGQK